MNPRAVSIALLTSVAALPSLTALAADSLPIDSTHSAVVFSWSHLGYSRPVARLEQIIGAVTLDRSDITKSAVDLRLPLTGLRTGVELLDSRLKKAEFLDAVEYPAIAFRSVRIETTGADTLKVTGDLTVRGVTKRVTLDAKINRIEAAIAGFDADATIRRSDFGVSKYVPAVSDLIQVHITLDAHSEE